MGLVHHALRLIAMNATKSSDQMKMLSIYLNVATWYGSSPRSCQGRNTSKNNTGTRNMKGKNRLMTVLLPNVEAVYPAIRGQQGWNKAGGLGRGLWDMLLLN